MAEVDPRLVPLPEDQPPQLPPFWTSRPRAWFTYVESRFRLRGIDDDQQKFDHVLSALPAEMVSQVIDLMDTLPEVNQYEFFKSQILDIHELSDYEKFDMLTKMEPMGDRKPSTTCWSYALWEWRNISPSPTSSYLSTCIIHIRNNTVHMGFEDDNKRSACNSFGCIRFEFEL